VKDATITAPTSAVPTLLEDLLQHGITAIDTGLEGRYHTEIHKDIPGKILEACHDMLGSNLPNNRLIRSNTDGHLFDCDSGNLIIAILQCILVEQANWYSTISAAASMLAQMPESSFILSIGSDAVPKSIAKRFPVSKVHAMYDTSNTNDPVTRIVSHAPERMIDDQYPEHAIAVVGMACKFPGADSLEEFWDLLSKGKSMVERMPKQRFSTNHLPRSHAGLQFWGNFLSDADSFDHKFFKKSARESASMDPQQRLLLEVTYKALESSGYFADTSQARDIGCYIGSCSTDYDANVASHPATAYSTVGTLRAFMSGKLSHYFGWSGPSLVFDTACSSSAVAIHTACTALRMGECSQAIAGGVALFTSPYLYENLAAAHFLSPTGASKPFDASADGYCRGEGVGLVVLKRLSDAVANNDHILGVIAGSAVNQNNNSVPITVPHSSSQADLYTRVSKQAGINPRDVSFVEAHGTGTPVGDPIEMESLRRVFGGPERSKPLYVSSVKGNIGHLEGASGIAALIKALLQMEYRTACVQASFSTLNPKIPALEPDHMLVPIENHELPEDLLTACINNYGAAGSNAAMIVIEGPRRSTQRIPSTDPYQGAEPCRYPIRIAAASVSSLLAYAKLLDNYCTDELSSIHSTKDSHFLASLAFGLSRHQNQNLAFGLLLTATDTRQLQFQLRQQTAYDNTIQQRPKEPPVVLCFGGQVSDCVGLDERLWHKSSLLRFHLDLCDETLRSMGYPGLYPGIFKSTKVEDVVALQSMVFATQYASAQAWIHSGLKIDGVVGHSLGQIAALCVSGTLSLRDGLKLVAGRAALMREHWGPESGTMVAVESDLASLESLMVQMTAEDDRHQFEIACYNGPTSHVIVCDRFSADKLEEVLIKRAVRHKRLNVTYGFHSQFTNPMIPHLERLASSLTFHEPKIALETCTNGTSWPKPTPQLVAAHTRDPVYFAQAVKRLQSRLGACTWLEAGSDSSIVGMVRRVFPQQPGALDAFMPMQLNRPSSLDRLVDVTLDLWKRGHQVQFWNFHRTQAAYYDALRLPSYQFEKTKHWLELNTAPQVGCECKTSGAKAQAPLLSTEPAELIRHTKSDDSGHLFDVNPGSDEYQTFVKGHAVLGSPTCPPALYVELVSRAMALVKADKSTHLPSIEGFQIESPLTSNTDCQVRLHLQAKAHTWFFRITSESGSPDDATRRTTLSHATGGVSFHASAALAEEFARFERIASRERIAHDLLSDPKTELVKGGMVYKLFAQFVNYAEYYRGVESIASKAGHIVGTVQPPAFVPGGIRQSHIKLWILDSFFQLANLHANCIVQGPENNVFWLTKIDRIQMGREYNPLGQEANAEKGWHVLSFASPGSAELTYDIFIYDAMTDRLDMMILGARFTKMDRTHLARLILHPGRSSSLIETEVKREIVHQHLSVPVAEHTNKPIMTSAPQAKLNPPTKDPKTAIYEDICSLVEKIADIPRTDIMGTASFDDVGVDSLMMIEVINEISTLFHIDLPLDDLEKLTDFDSLVQYLHSRGCVGSGSSAESSSSDSSGTSSPVFSSMSTSSPAMTTPSETPSSTIIAKRLSKLVAEHLELDTDLSMNSNLADQGLDSLLCIELASDIKKNFSVDIDMERLDVESTFADLLSLVMDDDGLPNIIEMSRERAEDPLASTQMSNVPPSSLPSKGVAADVSEQGQTSLNLQQVFEDMRFDFDKFANKTGFKDFWTKVYPAQANLVVAYIAQAFRELGCDLASLPRGQTVPSVDILPKHGHLLARLHQILADGGLLTLQSDGTYARTAKPIDPTPLTQLFTQMMQQYPSHVSETKLLNVTGSRLRDCLTGKADPLQLLFANKSNREILAEVYDIAPMCQATTQLLANFLANAFSMSSDRTFRILEVGAGTGGTARYLVDFLSSQGVKFEYTFTDISGALVNAARKKFTGKSEMKFMTLDCDREPAKELWNQYDAIIATNCIHATKNATTSAANLAPMLHEDGVFCLVEFTKGLYWFDLVYGLLEGWWLFSDGRRHALGDEWFWSKSLSSAGYKHVSWTDGSTTESQTMRLICAFKQEAQKSEFMPAQKAVLQRRAGIPTETFVWKRVDGVELMADIYYPKMADELTTKRPIGKNQCKIMGHGSADTVNSAHGARRRTFALQSQRHANEACQGASTAWISADKCRL
jgi:acyl transferase domain-containing protein/SAM-dependent methyltransferase